MRRIASLCILALVACALSFAAQAHEVRPAYLHIDEATGGGLHVLWKRPATGDYALSISPSLSSGWLNADPVSRQVTDDSLTEDWRIDAPHAPLAGQTLSIEGLDRTVTDVLVGIDFSDGTKLSRLIKPDHPSFVVTNPGRASFPIAAYLHLGIEHILTGPDHLLFIFGLMLLVRNLKTLIKTITAFTLAHSVTLAFATLNIISVPPKPIEAVIALSIIYVAVELIHVRQGRSGVMERAPWVVAFTFGLLHGLGFAGALREIGLPHGDVPLALLLFNCGIEVGQLIFVAAAMAILMGLKRLSPLLSEHIIKLSPYAVGSLASFWLIERTIGAL